VYEDVLALIDAVGAAIEPERLAQISLGQEIRECG